MRPFPLIASWLRAVAMIPWLFSSEFNDILVSSLAGSLQAAEGG